MYEEMLPKDKKKELIRDRAKSANNIPALVKEGP